MANPASITNDARRPARPRRSRPRWPRRLLWGALIALGLSLIVFAAWPKPVPVDIARAERTSLVVTVDEDGRTRIKDRYVISAPLGGEVARIDLDPGAQVTEGQVITRIAPTSAPLLDVRSRQTAEARRDAALAGQQQALARVAGIRSSLAFAEREAQQLEQLSARDVVSQRELERAQLQVQTLRADLAAAELAVKVATHELEMARAALGQVTGQRFQDQFPVTSPIRGQVLEVLQKSAGVVQPGTPLVTLGDPRALEVVIDVLTRDAVLIQPGAAATLERWGGPDLSARVRLVEPAAFTRTSSLGVEEQRVNVILDLTLPPEQWQALGDGYRVEARIVVWQGDGVLTVPASAVFRSGEGWAAFAVEDERAVLRPVGIGQRTPAAVQITTGLDEGALVIAHPSDQIQDGVSVSAREDGAPR